MTHVPKTSKELDNAIEDDRRYQEVDAAKKRAVMQRVDYDTFKNLVSVAHLRPLQAPDEIQRVKGAPAWKFNALGQRGKSSGAGDLSNSAGGESAPFEPTEQPTSSAGFERTWKKSCKTSKDRFNYIRYCSLDTLAKIFKIELSSILFSSILDIFCEVFVEGSSAEATEDAKAIFQILQCLTTAGRFSLTVKLLSSKHKKSLGKIVDQIGSTLDDVRGSPDFEKLLKDYGIAS